jgi:hypothetical protein
VGSHHPVDIQDIRVRAGILVSAASPDTVGSREVVHRVILGSVEPLDLREA